MNKELATKLNEKALLIAERFSKNNREGNVNNENFEIKEIITTSDHTAVVYFKKNTGKIGMAFFYYITKGMSKGWKYFFPTDSHINGMMSILYYKLDIERNNYKHNFKKQL